MALEWSIRKRARFVVVSGTGAFDPSFLYAYLAAMRDAGAAGYRKFVDLRRADIRFSIDDFRAIGARLARLDDARAGDAPGPIAILVGLHPPDLLLDMALLLKQHVGLYRRLRIFTQEEEAREWLDSQVEARVF